MSRETATAALHQLTDEEADLLNNSPDLLEKFKEKHDIAEQNTGNPFQQSINKVSSTPGILPKIYESLNVPEAAAKTILPKLTQLQSMAINKTAEKTGLPIGEEPTGNLPRDIIANIPRIIGETGQEFIPGLVNRPSLMTMGALEGLNAAAPVINGAGRALAKGAESISGLEYKTPGVLKEAFNNPKLIFSPGKEAAEYEAAKQTGGQVRDSLLKIPEKLKFVKKALDLADKGDLNATEALEARKELSAARKSVTGEYFRKGIEKLNEMAKPVFGEADEAFKQGIKADALRMPLPVNKGGGTSIAKGVLGTLGGIVPLAAMSPVVQGGIASGLGAAAPAAKAIVSNPVTSAVISQLVPQLKELTREIAVKFLKKAKGDKAKAEEMARAKGYNTEKLVEE